MSVSVSLPLFGTPGQELEEGTDLAGKRLRALSIDLQGRLDRAADILDKLEAAGREATTGVHDAILSHPGAQSEEDARRLLLEAEIDPEELIIFEDVMEDEV